MTRFLRSLKRLFRTRTRYVVATRGESRKSTARYRATHAQLMREVGR